MERNKIAGILCAIIAFLLVVMAGKSCSESIDKTNKANRNKATNSAESSSHSSVSADDEEKTAPPANVKYDIFGRPIIPTEAASEEVQPVTDEDGNIIEPETEIYTDEDGNPTEAPTSGEETSADDGSGEETTEDADQPPTAPPGFSGFDHKKYDDDGNEVATIPPDFVIVIE